LEIASQSLAAILATWLGLTVVSRAPGERAPRVFAWVSLLLVAWSVAILVERTTSDPVVAKNLNALEDVAAFLLPAAALHIILAFTAEGPYPIWQSGALMVAYAVGAAMGIQQILDPDHPLSVVAPRLEPSWVSGLVLAWAWIGFRIAVFALAVWLATRAYAVAGEDRSRRNQALAALVTIALASIGGTLRFLPRDIAGPNWVGVSFITLALIVATYAVFGQGVFLSPGAIRNAFRYSLLAGLAVALYVGTLAILEASVEPILHTTLPIVMVLALVATVALLDPVREQLQRLFDPARTSREAARRRLGRALGIKTLADQPPEVAIQPAIERLARYLRFRQALVSTTEGAAMATLGGGLPDGAPSLAVPLIADGRRYGEARFGPRLDGRPYSTRESALLEEAADYFAASLYIGELRDEQAQALADLGAQQRELARRGSELHDSLTGTAPAATLRVHALGPMRVERNGEAIHNWGGPKAGSRQAEAIFAFLFDRGDRGGTKDEITDVVWPDVDIERADLAFHRTLVGLRGVLEPARSRREASHAITFHNDRYRLDPSLVAWSDVATFEDLTARGGSASEPDEAIGFLEQARQLIRGDFLDDCPFYGDSEYIEETRGLMRGRHIDLLVTLGERYEARGDRPAAATAFREALLAAGGECRSASDGLARLGATA
jgi:DNA-binding SARP family transcriptional activator